jgi:hypothetical protein
MEDEKSRSTTGYERTAAKGLQMRIQKFVGYADLPRCLDRKVGDAHAEESASRTRSAALMVGRDVFTLVACASSELDDHALAHEGRTVCNTLVEGRQVISHLEVTYGRLRAVSDTDSSDLAVT